MDIQNLQNEKLELITWISQLQDFSVIEKLKSIQSKSQEIPQWQKDEIDRRLYLIESGQMKSRSWEEAQKDIFKKSLPM